MLAVFFASAGVVVLAVVGVVSAIEGIADFFSGLDS
jgi:hypothetical protein